MDCKTKNICIDEAVTVRLWNTENMSENILQSRLDKSIKSAPLRIYPAGTAMRLL